MHGGLGPDGKGLHPAQMGGLPALLRREAPKQIFVYISHTFSGVKRPKNFSGIFLVPDPLFFWGEGAPTPSKMEGGRGPTQTPLLQGGEGV